MFTLALYRILSRFLKRMNDTPGFKQDGATAHMAKKTMDVLTEFFEDRIILKGNAASEKSRFDSTWLLFVGML